MGVYLWYMLLGMHTHMHVPHVPVRIDSQTIVAEDGKPTEWQRRTEAIPYSFSCRRVIPVQGDLYGSIIHIRN